MKDERVCPVCGCELVPTQVPTEECDDLLLCCYNESCNYQVASKAEVYEIDVLESFECIGGGTDELVLWSDDSTTIRHIPATE